MAAAEQHNFADQLNIDTPEQVGLEFAVAGIGSRFVAVLIDHLIQAGFYLVFGLLAAFALGSLANRINLLGKWFAAVFIAANFLLIWGYFTLFEAFWHGQTPGKRVMKLRVIKDSGRQITLFEAMARNLLRVFDYLPSLYLVGVITMLFTKRNQRLGDLAAGTLVVHERIDAQPLLIEREMTSVTAPPTSAYGPVTSSHLAGTFAVPAERLALLGTDDLLLIESFFARALDLGLDTRAQIAGRIAAQTARKMSVEVPSGNPERFLEALAYAMRSSLHKRR